jgi:uncharacterized protein YbjT (DUF2867 family)
MQILVVGSTGVVGRAVCRHLVSAGHTVRALVRASSDPATVRELAESGIETVAGDLADPGSVASACAGTDAVVSTATAISSQQPGDSLFTTDREGQLGLVDAAVAAGVRRFVFVSVLGLEPNSPFSEAKLAVEARLRASGLTYTIVQPSIFMDTWLSHHVGFDTDGASAVIYGDGTRPLRWVHSSDVAEIVAAALDAPAAENAVVPVVGPEALTPHQVVEIFEEVTGRSFTRNQVPAEHLEAQRAAAEHPTEQSFAALMLRYAAGDPDDVEPVEGLPAAHTTVEQYARRLTGA